MNGIGLAILCIFIYALTFYKHNVSTPKYQYYYSNTHHSKTKEHQEQLVRITQNGKEILRIEIYNNISIQIYNHKSNKNHSILLKDLKSFIILELLSDNYKLVALRSCEDTGTRPIEILDTKYIRKLPLKIVIDIYNILMNIID